MKKILILILIFLCTGCANNNTECNVSDDNNITVSVYRDSLYKLYPENTVNAIDEYIEDSGSIADSMMGTAFPEFLIETYDGDRIQIGGSKIIFEIASIGCHYCKDISSDVMDDLINAAGDYHVYQYFYDGDKESVDEFYNDIGKDIPDNITILMENKAMNTWLIQHNVTSAPSFVFVNEKRDIELFATGAADKDVMIDLVKGMNKADLYLNKVDGEKSISSFLKEQTKIKQYLDEATEVVVPKEIFE